VIYVQTAEGATVDMKRPLGRNATFNYYDLYREKLPEMSVAFFSYEGRGIRMGDAPPRYETIDWDVYNTSTLENKVRDILSAIEVVKRQKGVNPDRILLMGASEGTLLCAEAAVRAKADVKGLILYGVLSSTLKDMLTYMAADASFASINAMFDTDKNGKTSRAEFDADPGKNRDRALKGVAFETLDESGDGLFTVEDLRVLRKPILDAIARDNYRDIEAWLKQTAVVSTPKNWVQDHFSQPSMWSFLSQLSIPVGLFQGNDDRNTPASGTRKLEEQAKAAGKTNLEFHYFDSLDHSLGITEWFVRKTLPEGHKAIFEFIQSQTR
jgi:pimeloyl-ACP methyl ester carboxylesterase